MKRVPRFHIFPSLLSIAAFHTKSLNIQGVRVDLQVRDRHVLPCFPCVSSFSDPFSFVDLGHCGTGKVSLTDANVLSGMRSSACSV